VAFVKEEVRQGDRSGSAADDKKARAGVDPAEGHVFDPGMGITKARLFLGAVQMMLKGVHAVLGSKDFGPGHRAMADIAAAVDAPGQRGLGAAQDFDDEAFGQMGADLLMGADQDVIGGR